ncbi:BON domain-containing protein [Agrobacterium rhizogenes]|jgi:osmotically-inducible protein OsmY|uniref:BON domain-containing protein n=2 Tax=unclassified Rhizobium TaxID=2613769 RepID=A0AAU7SMT4_9HYPH|nr:BON domain-containing protein [Rhizobium rhizogenes]NTJ77980.1 BON domain-containing protein [Rhizobium rhizogenes]
MTETKQQTMAKNSPDRGDMRTLQALDQAAGGSGDIVAEEAKQYASAEIRPEHGTDDARCEDSAECDLQREQTAEEISVRVSNIRTVSGSREAGDGTMPEDWPANTSSLTQERTDVEIRTEIEGRLKADQLLNEASIFVTVSRGRVIVEGSVENHEAKQRAEAISRQASGIVGHDSNLAVRKSS